MIKNIKEKGTVLYWNLKDNNYYGHLTILKKYCHKKYTLGIPGLLQHGWTSGSEIYDSISPNFNVNFFVWNERNYNVASKLQYNKICPVGAPFIYLPFDKLCISSDCSRNSLLVFPVHTWEKEGLLDPIKFFRKYVSDINKLKSDFDEIVACLYFIEYGRQDIRKLFENNNIKTLSLGHREGNPNFLINFINIANNFNYVTSNIISTAIFYSMFLKKRVFIYGNRPKSEDMNVRAATKIIFENCQNIYEQYPVLHWEHFDDKTHIEIGKNELGYSYKKNQDDLRNIFGWV